MVFFDIEGTLVSNNTWKTVIAHPEVAQGRVRRAYAEVVPPWLLARVRLLNDTTFRHKWVVSMAKLFNGWTSIQLNDLFLWVAQHVEYHQDVVEKLRQHKRDGQTVILVSGIFEEGAKQIAAHLGADDGIGTRLGFAQGVCTGEITGESCAGGRKLDFIRAYLQRHGRTDDLAEAYAYADSYSDIPMLAAVGYATATYPEDDLRSEALQRGWTIFPN
jgi:HAD superfamily hydrolase (TIGR01490 family)